MPETKEKPQERVGVGFYDRKHWKKLRETAADAELLEEDYEDWLEVYESNVARLKEAGKEVHRIEVRVKRLLEFCFRNKYPNDGIARSRYVEWQLTSGKGVKV